MMWKPKILIIDDEPTFRDSIFTILEGDFHPVVASSGENALSILNISVPSLILLDMWMPDMTGLEVLERIRLIDSNLPVIILTGHSRLDIAERCAELHVHGYIRKPFDANELVIKIKKLLKMADFEDFKVLQILWGCSFETKIISICPSIKRSLEFIHKNYDKNLTRDEISDLVNMSPEYLSRQFHSQCGVHLIEYINIYKVHKSMEYLKNSTLSVKDIARLVSFSDVNYFCRIFKKYVDRTPGEFRKEPSYYYLQKVFWKIVYGNNPKRNNHTI